MTQYAEQIGIEALYRQKPINSIPFVSEVVQQYNQYADELDLPEISDFIDYSKEFNIPQHYKELDVEEYIKGLIPTSGQDVNIITARVEQELAEFKARNLFPVLQLLIYIVDTLRKHSLVWGVGRGSSVASYCLYLIGVHKIDSIKYNLDIREFLK